MQNSASSFDITRLWAARILKRSKISEIWYKLDERRWWPYVLFSFDEFGPLSPENCAGIWAPLKIWRRKCGKSSITQPRIVRFRSNFVRQLMYYTNSRSRGQMSRSQGVLYINNIQLFILTYRTQQCNRTRFRWSTSRIFCCKAPQSKKVTRLRSDL